MSNLLAGEPISAEKGVCVICGKLEQVRTFYKENPANKYCPYIVHFFCYNCFHTSVRAEGFCPVLCDTTDSTLGVGRRVRDSSVSLASSVCGRSEQKSEESSEDQTCGTRESRTPAEEVVKWYDPPAPIRMPKRAGEF